MKVKGLLHHLMYLKHWVLFFWSNLKQKVIFKMDFNDTVGQDVWLEYTTAYPNYLLVSFSNKCQNTLFKYNRVFDRPWISLAKRHYAKKVSFQSRIFHNFYLEISRTFIALSHLYQLENQTYRTQYKRKYGTHTQKKWRT